MGATNLFGGKVAGRDGERAMIALDAGATVRLPAAKGLAAGAPILLSVRPEQLALCDAAGPDRWRIEPGLSLPLGAQLVHEVRTADGNALKIVEPRLGLPRGARLYCTLAPDAKPSLFPRSMSQPRSEP